MVGQNSHFLVIKVRVFMHFTDHSWMVRGLFSYIFGQFSAQQIVLTAFEINFTGFYYTLLIKLEVLL